MRQKRIETVPDNVKRRLFRQMMRDSKADQSEAGGSLSQKSEKTPVDAHNSPPPTVPVNGRIGRLTYRSGFGACAESAI